MSHVSTCVGVHTHYDYEHAISHEESSYCAGSYCVVWQQAAPHLQHDTNHHFLTLCSLCALFLVLCCAVLCCAVQAVWYGSRQRPALALLHLIAAGSWQDAHRWVATEWVWGFKADVSRPVL
jgi:hypothetical protein